MNSSQHPVSSEGNGAHVVHHTPRSTRPSVTSGLHPLIYRLLKNRQMSDQEIENFFKGSLKDLPAFEEMRDLTKAANFLAQSIQEKKSIGIYGDYDVDGTTSCALLVHFFRLCGYDEVITIQPSRFKEGYGLHESSIDDAVAKGIEILITVDCGITAVAPAAYAKQKGPTLIITDHHQDIAESLPDAFAVINPNRRDDLHPQWGALAGVGVAFALAVCTKEILQKQYQQTLPSLYPLLPFVGIGSLADLAKLNGANRLLVGHGLRALETSSVPGLKLLYEHYGPPTKEAIKSDMVGFGIGPLINAKGRMDHPELALKLLTTKEEQEAHEIFNELKQANELRKDTQKKITQEAITLVERESLAGEHAQAVIVFGSHWHEGVIGIVAAKLVEHFSKPALVFAKDLHLPHHIKGSGRAPKGVHLLSYLEKVKSLFVKFGGHAAAAGMTLAEENFLPLKEQLNAALAVDYPQGPPTLTIESDLTIDFQDITFELFSALQTLEPFGNGNPVPIFRIRGVHLEDFTILRGGHLQWKVGNGKTGFGKRSLKGISFNYLGRPGKIPPQELINAQTTFEVHGKILENVYRGSRSLQLEILEFLPLTSS